MKKRARIFAVFFALVLVLSGVYLILETARPEPYVPPEQGVILLIEPWRERGADWNRRAGDAVRLTIEALGEETIYFEPDGRNQWFSVTRERLPVAQYSVDLALTAFADIVAAEIFMQDPDGALLEEFGLSPAETVVTVEYEDGAVFSVLIGHQTPDRLFRYVMTEGGSNVYLVPPLHVNIFLHGYDRFVNRALPAVSTLDITSVYVGRRGHPPIVIERIDGYEIHGFEDMFATLGLVMTSPISNLPADIMGIEVQLTEHINQMGDLLGNLVEINPQDLSVFGLDDPRLEIKIEFGRRPTYHLIIGDIADAHGGESYAVFGGLDGVWIARNMFLFELFRIDPFEMALRLLNIIEPRHLRSIELELTGGRFEFLIEQDGQNLNVLLNGEPVADSDFTAFYTAYLLALSIQGMAGVPHAREGEPIERVTFTLNDGTVITNEFFDYNVVFYGISADGGDITYLIQRDMLAALGNAAERLLD